MSESFKVQSTSKNQLGNVFTGTFQGDSTQYDQEVYGDWDFTPVAVLTLLDCSYSGFSGYKNFVSYLAYPAGPVYWCLSGKQSDITWYAGTQAQGYMETKCILEPGHFKLAHTGDAVYGNTVGFYRYWCFKDLTGITIPTMNLYGRICFIAELIGLAYKNNNSQ